MSDKTTENILVITLLGIILCLVFPIVQNIIYKAQLSSIKSSVYGTIDSVELLYIQKSSQGTELPFTVVFNKKGYKAYLGSTNIGSGKMIKKGRVATGGKIIIHPDSTVSVVKLKYEHFICSKSPNGKVNCKSR